MKIWTLQTASPETGSIYITSEQEAVHYTDLFKNRFYTKEAIGKNWPDTMMYSLPATDFSKFVFSGQVCWICSEKAKELIAPLLQKSVEFLPLIHRKKARKKISYAKQLFRKKVYKPVLEMMPDEPHFMLNISALKSLEVIDAEQSDLRYDEENDTIYSVEKLVFKPKKIEDIHLFKIDYPNSYFQTNFFISDEFKTLVEQNNLKGLVFSAEAESEDRNLVWDSQYSA